MELGSAEMEPEVSRNDTDPRPHLTYTAGTRINEFCLPVICVAGLTGNTLALLVLLQPRNRQIPCYLYLTGLAVSDSAVLSLGICTWCLTVLSATPLRSEQCRLLAYFFQWACLTGSLLIVFATIHKFFAFCFPLRMTTWRTVNKALQIIVTTFIVSAVLNIPYFFTAQVLDDQTCVGTRQEI